MATAVQVRAALAWCGLSTTEPHDSQELTTHSEIPKPCAVPGCARSVSRPLCWSYSLLFLAGIAASPVAAETCPYCQMVVIGAALAAAPSGGSRYRSSMVRSTR
jgi:hypothetical protein